MKSRPIHTFRTVLLSGTFVLSACGAAEAPTGVEPPDSSPGGLSLSTAPAGLQSVLDFEDGLLPSAHGWAYHSQCFPNFSSGVNIAEGAAASVVGPGPRFLRLDTTGPATYFTDAFYGMSGALDTSLPVHVEARLRVVSVEGTPPSTTQAFSLNVQYDGGLYLLQVTDGDVRAFDPPEPGVAVATGGWHTYAIDIVPGAPDYTISLDGVPVLTTAVGSLDPSFNDVLFGDTTCQSRNAVVEIDYFQVKQVPPTLAVDIDIKPGSDPNCFNNDGKGVIPVAILGMAGLDVNDIDPNSVMLEGMAVRAVGRGNKLLSHIEDVDGDGIDDLVVQIEDEDGVWEEGTSAAILTGELYDGTPIEGSDEVCITP